MKYEAKDVSSIATSQADSTPWVSITLTTALTACRALGIGYDLISNPDWMTLGANIAAKNSNWTGGTVGSGTLIAGHTDGSPASVCAASSDDALFYVESNCTPLSSGDTSDQRRTLILSNNEVIWDLSGNVNERVNYINLNDKPGATTSSYEYNALTGTTTTALKDLVPTNAVKSYWSDSWNSTQRIGTFFPYTNGIGGALERGADFSTGAGGGVFTALLHNGPTALFSGTSFRCRLTVPTP